MSHAFAEFAYRPSVKAAQQRDGRRSNCARNFEGDAEVFNDRLGEAEVDFIAAQRSCYLATVPEIGWPCRQHRGGPRGLLKILDDGTLAYADYAGNWPLVSMGNLATNDRVALILMDHAQRVRLKLLGRPAVQDLAPQDALAKTSIDPAYRARPQRAMVITVDDFDLNCPQHIPARIAVLEGRIAHRAAGPPASG